MLINLEGPDGSGKTTLSDAITAELIREDLPVIQTKDGKCKVDTHPKSRYRNKPTDLISAMTDMAYSDNIFVLDRGPISDVVYRNFDDYEPVITERQVYDLLFLLKRQIIIVYCRTDIAEQKMLERGDDNLIAIVKHKEITKKYDYILSYIINRCQVLRFDYSKETAEDFAKRLVEIIKIGE